MRNILGVLIFGCLIAFNNPATAKPDTLWTRSYGGSIEHDVGYTVQQTFDGGYIIIGETESYGEDDIYLIKTDALGDTIWTKTSFYEDRCGLWGGGGGPYGQQTSDSGYIITGWTNPAAGFSNLFILKINSLGDTVWTKIYSRDSVNIGQAIRQTSDGGYVITGYTGSEGSGGDIDVWLLKTDSLGDILWTKTYGDADWEEGFSIQQTLDGGYIITGYKNPGTGNTDSWLIKTDANGNLLWDKTFGDSGNDYGFSVRQTTDGGYIIVGDTEVSGEYAWLIKTDANGNKLWDKTFGVTTRGNCVQQTQDGGYIITGSGQATNGIFDLWVVKTDSLGDTLWTQVYGGTSSEHGYYVQQTSDGGYIITGVTNSSGIAGNLDVWLLKIEPEPVDVEEKADSHKIDESFILYQNTPNPFTQKTVIRIQGLEVSKKQTVAADFSLSIYDLAGKLTCTLPISRIQSPVTEVVWDGRDNFGKRVPNGVYFYKLRASDCAITKKMYLIK